MIARVMLPKYIVMPSDERLGEIIEGFERKFGFPNCGGAIDGTHIPIIAPQHHHTDYYNRKGYYSIVAQVVCDHEYKVLSVVAGWPGRVHDARVFTNSSIYAKGNAGTLFPHRPRRLGETDVPVVLLGDPAYPLLPWLMKPFSDTGRLTREQRNYNYQHSRARMVIENTFGRCKARWRILHRRIDVATEDVTTVILACFTLNNICEVHKETFDAEWLNVDVDVPPPPPAQPQDIVNNAGNATGIRQAFVEHFSAV